MSCTRPRSPLLRSATASSGSRKALARLCSEPPRRRCSPRSPSACSHSMPPRQLSTARSSVLASAKAHRSTASTPRSPRSAGATGRASRLATSRTSTRPASTSSTRGVSSLRGMLEQGAEAPDFELPDQDGTPVKLSDLRGQTVVLYFYPRADTPGCTTQACGVRDHRSDYETAGAAVYGISPDP